VTHLFSRKQAKTYVIAIKDTREGYKNIDGRAAIYILWGYLWGYPQTEVIWTDWQRSSQGLAVWGWNVNICTVM